ncbi:hypothetical protein QF023_002529 [Chryseobacterium sp. SLBN-27]|nr:hypothetical protein [Chryseobacterium sp. SLBN-27]
MRFDFCYVKFILKPVDKMKNTYNLLIPRLKNAFNNPFKFFERNISPAVEAINSTFTFDIDFYHK